MGHAASGFCVILADDKIPASQRIGARAPPTGVTHEVHLRRGSAGRASPGHTTALAGTIGGRAAASGPVLPAKPPVELRTGTVSARRTVVSWPSPTAPSISVFQPVPPPGPLAARSACRPLPPCQCRNGRRATGSATSRPSACSPPVCSSSWRWRRSIRPTRRPRGCFHHTPGLPTPADSSAPSPPPDSSNRSGSPPGASSSASWPSMRRCCDAGPCPICRCGRPPESWFSSASARSSPCFSPTGSNGHCGGRAAGSERWDDSSLRRIWRGPGPRSCLRRSVPPACSSPSIRCPSQRRAAWSHSFAAAWAACGPWAPLSPACAGLVPTPPTWHRPPSPACAAGLPGRRATPRMTRTTRTTRTMGSTPARMMPTMTRPAPARRSASAAGHRSCRRRSRTSRMTNRSTKESRTRATLSRRTTRPTSPRRHPPARPFRSARSPAGAGRPSRSS